MLRCGRAFPTGEEGTVGRQFTRTMEFVNGVNYLRPKIPGMEIPPIDALVEPFDCNKHRTQPVLLNQFTCRTLDGLEHAVTLLSG